VMKLLLNVITLTNVMLTMVDVLIAVIILLDHFPAHAMMDTH
jgi:hypothetical protein